jgi:uncharacterized membrane protein
MKRLQTTLRLLAAIFFVVAGTLHFVKPDLYRQIIPPFLPAAQLLVVVSGIAEIAGGLGLLLAPMRRAAGWGLIALLIAVFPANVYMALHAEQFHITPWLLWARLPLQAVFIAWVWWAGIQHAPRGRNGSQSVNSTEVWKGR